MSSLRCSSFHFFLNHQTTTLPSQIDLWSRPSTKEVFLLIKPTGNFWQHFPRSPWGHREVNYRANMYCVSSSSPTTGLRTIHLLRSILFRALPWHAIAPNSTFCLHLRLILKIGLKLSFRRSTHTLSYRRSVYNHRSGNSCWILYGLSDFALTQFKFTCCHIDDETLGFFKKVFTTYSYQQAA